ncbi:MAG: tail fiber domain-containing protein [Bacteroidetes bacterium]|nr:tail fiber domain-containing protein [Bacteroidota bacterium]
MKTKLLFTTVKYAPSLLKCFRTSNVTPKRSFFSAGQARQALHFTWQAFAHSKICSFTGKIFSYLNFRPGTVILPYRAGIAFHVACFCLLPFALFSQAPQGFNYQAVARDGDNTILANTAIDIKIGLLQGSESGTLIWEEIHLVTTNDMGLFTLKIGDTEATNSGGTAAAFADIDWTLGSYYMKVQVKDGGGYVDMGTAELLSVPYAMFAKTTDDSDSDPFNEIQDLQLAANNLTITNNPSATNINLTPYLDNTNWWTKNGDSVYVTGINVGIGTSSPGGRLQVLGATTNDEEPLFEVKNKDGQTVFAVYNNGVRVYVDDSGAKGLKGGFAVGGFSSSKGAGNYMMISPDSVRFYIDTSSVKGLKGGFAVGGFSSGKGAGQEYLRVTGDSVRIYVDRDIGKGPKGGFAVGGYSSSKGTGNEYFRVTPDSVRVYLDTTNAKGPKGGFAVGGFSAAKGAGDEYLRVTGDSVRVYIPEEGGKGSKGGFAVGGYSAGKGLTNDYFNISGKGAAEIMDPSESRILWYPKKEAFLTGRVLIESPDSVGTNSIATGYESKAIGNWSQALGYQTIARGDYSTSIGKNSVTQGINTFAFGNQAQAIGDDSYALGTGAQALGNKSFAFGSVGLDSAGIATGQTRASSEYAFALGFGSQAIAQGAFAIGFNDTASGPYSLAMGYQTKASGYFSTAIGDRTTASGWISTAMGFETTASGPVSTAIGNRTTASEHSSTAMGFETTASGFASTAMGSSTMASGNSSTAMGSGTTSSALNSTAMGGGTVASGNMSTAMGNNTLANEQSSTAMGDFTTASGHSSTAMGWKTLASGVASTALGAQTTASGSNSTAMGDSTTASSWASTAMGYRTTASGDISTAMGSNASTNNKTGSFVYGDNSTSDSVYAILDNQFVVRAVGGTVFYSSSDLSTGVSLAAGGGSWSSVSDRNKKENYQDIEKEKVLEKLSNINIQSWNYKSQSPDIKHIGIVAQDFYYNFGFGESDTTITSIDLAGVNMVAVQGLINRTEKLNEQNRELLIQVSNQQSEIDQLKEIVNKLLKVVEPEP